MEKWKKVACKNLVGNLKATNKKIKLKKKKIQSKCTLGLVNMGTSDLHTSFKQEYSSIAFRYIIDLSLRLFKCALSN